MDQVIAVVVINAIISLLYMAYGLLKGKDRVKTLLLTVLFILMPVFGILCFGLSFIVYSLRAQKHIDITGIYFSDDKISYQQREDYVTGIDVTPLEEVLRISGVKEKRERLLSSIKSEISASMATYSAAVLNEDSEVSHYAAAMLSKTRDAFERSLNKLAQQYDLDRTDEEINLAYIRAEQEFLSSGLRLFREERMKHLYSHVMLCENLYKHHPDMLGEELFTTMIGHLVELEEHNRARDWLDIFSRAYPKNESAYTCRLHFYYETGERTRFFDTLSELKASGIPIGSSTIDLIRFFGNRTSAKEVTK